MKQFTNDDSKYKPFTVEDYIKRISHPDRIEGGICIHSGFNKKIESDKPLISIITVVHNGEKILEQTIQSVITQTYKNIEYIIIDGNSSDKTIDIIKKYDTWIDYWISEADKGIYDAMNKGIDLAKGAWINFMNAGDRFYEIDTIEKVFKECKLDSDFIYGHHQINYDLNFRKIQKALPIKDFWKGMIFCHQSLFVKTHIMKCYKFNIKNKVNADYEFIYSSYMNNFTFYNTDIVISSILTGGLSDSACLGRVKDHWSIARKFSNTMKVDIYYTLLITSTFLKKIFKDFLPKKIVNFMRSKF